MVLAAHDMRYSEVDVVDDAGQQVEPAAILPADNGVGQQPGIEPLRPSDEVGPFDRRIMIEAEAPVRRSAFGRSGIRGLALVNRWKSAPEQHLAPKLELLRRLVAAIDAPRSLQPLEFTLIEIEPL